MLAWSEELITTTNLKRGCDVIVGGELFTDYSDHPRKLVTLNPKLKSTCRTLPAFPVGGCLLQAVGLKDSLRKVRTLWALQQIKERGALIKIDRGDIRQAIDRCSNIWGFTAGRWLWSVRA